jgi:predicted nucleic acid-binding protein
VPEKVVIADTGPLVAFLSRFDLHHSWAVEQFKTLPAPFLTCEPVLTEAFHLLRGLKQGKQRFFQLLDSGLLAVEFDLLGERKALASLIRKYDSVPMSLADACVVRMTELQPKASVFTVDRDFLIYRRKGRLAISAILPPGA